jgi:hypothetical protein
LEWKKNNGEGILKAFVDIWVEPGWTLKALRLIHRPGRKPYVSASRCAIRDFNTEQLVFEQIVFTPPDVWQAIEQKILQRYEEESNGTEAKN